ncbi:M23 family metallopeptidase [Metabacillus sp. 22489]|uniref:M23 family metallopeptidase n=1 Tax=Metabacillus sp. 22489 TaxID=3453928 RepID=UPI003F82CEB9
MLKGNIFLLFVSLFLSILWLNVFFVRGVFGVLSWWLLLGSSILGIVLFLISIFLLVVKSLKGKLSIMMIYSVILFLIMSFPSLWFINIGQFAYPADLEKTSPSITIEHPFNQAAIVGWGGDSIETNRPHVLAPNERWAYDFIMEPHSTKNTNLEDYGIFNAMIYSPVKGTVIEVFDDEKDIPPETEENETMMGNYIFIKISETKTFLVLAHIKQNSILVKKGQIIEIGTPLARVGNSGSTSEPHLHIHHQRQNPTETSMYTTEGLPLFIHHREGTNMPIGGNNKDIIYPLEQYH